MRRGPRAGPTIGMISRSSMKDSRSSRTPSSSVEADRSAADPDPVVIVSFDTPIRSGGRILSARAVVRRPRGGGAASYLPGAQVAHIGGAALTSVASKLDELTARATLPSLVGGADGPRGTPRALFRPARIAPSTLTSHVIRGPGLHLPEVRVAPYPGSRAIVGHYGPARSESTIAMLAKHTAPATIISVAISSPAVTLMVVLRLYSQIVRQLLLIEIAPDAAPDGGRVEVKSQ